MFSGCHARFDPQLHQQESQFKARPHPALAPWEREKLRPSRMNQWRSWLKADGAISRRKKHSAWKLLFEMSDGQPQGVLAVIGADKQALGIFAK